MDTTVLVTGGAGYIGSHVVVELAAAGATPVVLDNFANSSPAVFPRLAALAGREVAWVDGDVRDAALVRRTLESHRVGAVVHCAGLKAVGESQSQPLEYYDVNVGGALALLGAMRAAGVATLVFSSSATVYGEPERLPVTEDSAVGPTSVYGRTKLIIEDILRDLARAESAWRIAILRYFNPAGAHPGGSIGEAPLGRPNNLVPLLCRVAAGEFAELAVFGTDWPTPDGTGVRDYLHVQDLAAGHVAALDYLARNSGATTVNLGVGRGFSVREVVAAFERACGRAVPRRYAARRPGDVACVYADPGRARALLGWRAVRDLDAICADAWRWQVSGGRY